MSEATESAAPADPPSIGYEDARDELIDVVKQLEGGGLTLEQSIALWERGEKLAEICQIWLDGARARLEAASTDSDD
jgi:exodeoxyribonuclease VII small subunit